MLIFIEIDFFWSKEFTEIDIKLQNASVDLNLHFFSKEKKEKVLSLVYLPVVLKVPRPIGLESLPIFWFLLLLPLSFALTTYLHFALCFRS